MRAIDGLILCGAVLGGVLLAFLAFGTAPSPHLCGFCGFMNGFPDPIEYGLPYPRLLSDFGRDGRLTEGEIQSVIEAEAHRPGGGYLIVQEANAPSIILDRPLAVYDNVTVNFDGAFITCSSSGIACFDVRDHGAITNIHNVIP